LLGTIRIADVLRPEAKSAVAAMRAMGLKTALLSGDVQEVTTSVGQSLGVDDAVGGLPCQIRRPIGSANFAKRIAKLRWSATASTTHQP
jgi:magnesium-transporting ATPase (P-type)